MLESKYKKLQKTYRKSEIKFHGNQVYDKSLGLKELFLEAVKTLYGCTPNKFKRWISIHQM